MLKKIAKSILILIGLSFCAESLQAVPLSCAVLKRGRKRFLIVGDLHTSLLGATPLGEPLATLDRPYIRLLNDYLDQLSKTEKTCVYLETGSDANHAANLQKLAKSNPDTFDTLYALSLIAFHTNLKYGNITFVPSDCRYVSHALHFIHKQLGAQGNDVATKKVSQDKFIEHVANSFSTTDFANYFRELDTNAHNLCHAVAQSKCPQKTTDYVDGLLAEKEFFKHQAMEELETFFRFLPRGNYMTLSFPVILREIFAAHKTREFFDMFNQWTESWKVHLDTLHGDFGFLQHALEAVNNSDNTIFYVGNKHAYILNNFLRTLGFEALFEIGSLGPQFSHKENFTDRLDKDAFEAALTWAFERFPAEPLTVSPHKLQAAIKTIEDHFVTAQKEAEDDVKEIRTLKNTLKTAQHNLDILEPFLNAQTARQEKSCTLCSKENCTTRCSRCKHYYYCSKACQTTHWKEHKKSCMPDYVSYLKDNCMLFAPFRQ